MKKLTTVLLVIILGFTASAQPKSDSLLITKAIKIWKNESSLDKTGKVTEQLIRSKEFKATKTARSAALLNFDHLKKKITVFINLNKDETDVIDFMFMVHGEHTLSAFSPGGEIYTIEILEESEISLLSTEAIKDVQETKKFFDNELMNLIK